jgi:hypothetical protein
MLVITRYLRESNIGILEQSLRAPLCKAVPCRLGQQLTKWQRGDLRSPALVTAHQRGAQATRRP